MSASVSAEWLRSRRRMLKLLQEQVRVRFGLEAEYIPDYSHPYFSELRRPWKISSHSELLDRLMTADIAYGGDFHAFGQSQRTHCKILRQIAVRRPVVLALEVISHADQKTLDRYLSGKISEEQFLTEVQWENSWGFPWEHYKRLIWAAHKAGCPVVGINTDRRRSSAITLKQRDRFSAKVIGECLKSHPGSLIYVVIGDLHIARSHLPEEVRKIIGTRRLEETRIFLNAENIYFQLAKRGLAHQVEVVRFNRSDFCLLASPPWVKWQSYLIYLESTHDLALEDEDEDEAGAVDYTDHLAALIRFLGQDFQLSVKTDQVQVYTPQDAFVDEVLDERLKDRHQRRLAGQLLEANKSFFLPESGLFYLAQPMINHAAALAGQFIHAALCGRKRLLWEMPQDFHGLIWVEAIGFFMSKIVNHRRRPPSLVDVRSQLDVIHSNQESRQALYLALDQKIQEIARVHHTDPVQKHQPFRARSLVSYIEAARFLGANLGDRLYQAYHDRMISRETLLDWLRLEPSGPDFERMYYDVLCELHQLQSRLSGRDEKEGR